MGARAQVKIEDTGVYLYTHWGSGSLVDKVRAALDSPQGRGRWNDEEYLTRIIFDKMSEGEHGEETGFGIGTQEHGDTDYDAIVVNCKEQTVTDPNGFAESFKEFVRD